MFWGLSAQTEAGKTALAKAIAGELPVSGEVTADGAFLKKRFVPFHSSLALSNGTRSLPPAAMEQNRY
jgi:ABC-type multidrug transport system ATPase subunit